MLIMKIDAHQHFWKYDPVEYDWIDDSMSLLKKDFLPEHLTAELSNCGFDGCIAVQARQTEEESRFLLDLARQNKFIKGVVGWVDLRNKKVHERLEILSKNKLLKGIRHIVQSEPDDFMLKKDFQNGISVLKQFNLTYDILIYPRQLISAIELVNHFPDQHFVIDHIAKPSIKEQKIESWKSGIMELALAPNVFCKISGLVTEADRKYWEPEDFTSYLDVIFDVFSIDHLMVGSDWPVCLLAAGYKQVMVIIEDYTRNFNKEDVAKVFGGNAIRFYDLETDIE